MNLTHTVRKPIAAVASAALLLAPVALLTVASLTGSAKHAYAQAPLPAAAATGTYDIDKPHSDISFTIVHMGLTKVHGKFDDFNGTVSVDSKKPEKSSVNFTIKVDSINTANTQRDAHLKTKEFFETATYPEISFKSSSILKKGKGFVAYGNLTMHGVTKAIILPFTVTGPVKGLEGGTHLGIETETVLKRSDFGIKSFPGVVGDDVNISIELDLVKQGSIPPAPAAK